MKGRGAASDYLHGEREGEMDAPAPPSNAVHYSPHLNDLDSRVAGGEDRVHQQHMARFNVGRQLLIHHIAAVIIPDGGCRDS